MSLEKIADNVALTKGDMIKAAHEYIQLEKEASDADAYGRALAHQYVEKLAADEEGGEEDSEEMDEEEEEKKAEDLVVKLASYLKKKETKKSEEQVKLAEAISYVKKRIG